MVDDLLLASVLVINRDGTIAGWQDKCQLDPSEESTYAPGSARRIFTAGPLTRHLHDALPVAIRGAHEANSAALAPRLAAEIRPGDIVLVKGSLGSRMAVIVQALRALGQEAGEADHAL